MFEDNEQLPSLHEQLFQTDGRSFENQILSSKSIFAKSDQDISEDESKSEPFSNKRPINTGAASQSMNSVVRQTSQTLKTTASIPSSSNFTSNSSVSTNRYMKTSGNKDEGLRNRYDILQTQIATMEGTVLNLQREVHSLREVDKHPDEYFYDGEDLLSIHGRNPLKYALKIVDIIFTRDELVNGVFLDPATARITHRTVMDSGKVHILQRKFH